VLEIIRDMLANGERPAIKAIADRLVQSQSLDTFEPITSAKMARLPGSGVSSASRVKALLMRTKLSPDS